MENYSHKLKSLPPWQVQNGYIDSTFDRIDSFNKLLQAEEGGDALQRKLETLLCIGVQEDTDITDSMMSDIMKCTQVYASAVSIGYSNLPPNSWEPLARLVLNAAYKATLLVGILKSMEAQSKGEPPRPILLTKLGAGVFKNKNEWVIDAISKALASIATYNVVDLDVRIVHFESIDHRYLHLESGLE